eukprot:555248-Amphidinium_carterae.1
MGPGRHSSNPHFRRYGVDYYTDTGESVFLPLPGLKQAVYRAEFLAVVRRLKSASRKGLAEPWPRFRLGFKSWMKAHQTDRDAEEGRVDGSDLHGNHQADVAANRGTSEHVPFEPSEEWKHWSAVCQAVRNIWLLVGPKLRNRPEQWPRIRLPAPELEPEVVESERPVRFPAELFICGPHLRVVAHETYVFLPRLSMPCGRSHWKKQTQPPRFN